jgi:FkbM family methyltransferase
MNNELPDSFESPESSSYTYNFDQLGGSFKSYVLNNSAPEAIARLKYGLDEISCAYIDYCLESVLQFPDLRFRHLFGENKKLGSNYYPQWLMDDVGHNISKNPPVGGYGISLLPDKVIDYIRGKVFFDLGAYDGWSVFELEKYSPKKVHSFDISPKNEALYRETSKNFSGAFEFHLLALGDSYGEILFDDLGTSGTNLFTSYQDPVQAKIIPFDDFVKKELQDEVVGVIKMDIEGSELSAVRGAEKTIRRNRPVLSISIYHNPHDFFEIKPLIESWGLGYSFRITKLSLEYEYTPIIDTVLLAYPSELE